MLRDFTFKIVYCNSKTAHIRLIIILFTQTCYVHIHTHEQNIHNTRNIDLNITKGIFFGISTESFLPKINGTKSSKRKLHPERSAWNCQKDVSSEENFTNASWKASIKPPATSKSILWYWACLIKFLILPPFSWKLHLILEWN